MGTFLQIVGGIVIGFIVLVLLALLALRLFVRYNIRKMEKLAEMMGGPVAPIGIRLVPEPNPEWPQPAEIRALQDEFARLGFVSAGAFTIEQIPQVIMEGFANSELPAYGCITYHPFSGIVCDVVQRAQDGRMLTLTHSKTLTKTRPINKTSISLPDASLTELVNEVKRRTFSGELEPHEPGRFVSVFESSYREDMKFQYEHGDLKGTDAEMIADLIHQEPDPETKEFLKSLEPPDEEDMDAKFREAFLAQSQMSALEWDKIRERVVFVHEDMDSDDVTSLVYDYYEGEEDPYDLEISGANSQEKFLNLTRALKMQEPKLLAELDEPSRCHVYQF